MKAKEFDEAFESDQDITEQLDLSKATRPNKDIKRVNVDFPAWMIIALDREATRLGVNRQAVIKTWIANRIDSQHPADH
ncbi:type II toxin-antitoxin system BrnA family antitoxin [Maridesulfovibrio ferrireducens]|uniref:type II toxin-antitoxin system BrnA family antitoxin n=1 Tax=Maridesulfovibrio ferrireducens TaxID=246191 RepID=UPI001A341EB9|nr:CopG family transcriptional regulator [Maridesulfovibrio ferrireducens]MBI9110060.1 CopG family transcriptional regulator [Maridesulfovibrio ferrireducens]